MKLPTLTESEKWADKALADIYRETRTLPPAYSGHRDHSVRSIVITRSEHRDRSSERSDARAIVSSLVPSSQAELLYQGDIPVAPPSENVACSASYALP